MANPGNESAINPTSLGWSLLLLLLAAAVTATAIMTVLQWSRQTDLAYRQALARQDETRSRLARAHDDEREIRAKTARYQELLRLGRTAPERRLDWVEALRHIKESRRLLGLDYEIAPQRPLDEKNVASGGYDFLVSPMKLTMPLLHENDLLGLIADLSAQVQAIVSVKHCKLERLAVDPAQQSAATLKATCDIDWITLQEKS